MHYRNLGATGLKVSAVGMGCNRLGEARQPDEHWVDLVRHAADLGVTLFDTSESYKDGRSEEMIGRALGNRSDVYIATKMSRDLESNERDFSAARMVKAVEGSLRRLRRDCIDIFQLHSPSREEMERYDWPEGMARLRQQGKINLRAVAIREPDDGIWLMEQGLVEVLQITYNIFEVAVRERLLPLAEERGVGLMVRMPLARGVLSGKFHPDRPVADDHRATLDGEKMQRNIGRAEDLRPLAETYPGGMTRLAHHFSLTPGAVSAIIPGARNRAQLEENVAASTETGLPPELQQRIEQIRQTWEE